MELVKSPQELYQEGMQSATQAGQQSGKPVFNSEADIDAYFTNMRLQQAEADRVQQEKLLQRQAAARTLTDLGGVFTDMIKASQGAIVSPRDIEKNYNDLSARQRQVFDAYRTRVDMIRKQQQDAALARDKMRQQKELADKNDALKRWQTEQQTKAQIRRAEIAAMGKVTNSTDNKSYEVAFGDKKYIIPKSAFDSRMANLYAFLKNNNLFKKDYENDSEFKSILDAWGSSNNSMAYESSNRKIAAAVLVSIYELTPEQMQEFGPGIAGILNGTKSEKPSGGSKAKTPKQNEQTSSGSLY